MSELEALQVRVATLTTERDDALKAITDALEALTDPWDRNHQETTYQILKKAVK